MLVWLIAGTLTAAGCTHATQDTSPPSGSVAPLSGPTAGPLANQEGHTTSWTARAVVNALADAGLAVPNAVDNTAQECPSAGCRQSIVTDTLRVKSFSTAAQAETYAAPRGLHRTGRIVVAFAPPLTEAERIRYRQALQGLAH